MPLLEGEYPLEGCSIRRGDVITIEDAKIIWPNFSGAKDQFNAEGDRNFNIHLTKQQADDLAADGWNVKCKPARPNDEDGEERCVLKVTVNFNNKPPKIVMVGSKTRNRTELGADIAGLMDSAELITVDLSFVPYFWEMKSGACGVSAYLKTLYCVVQEDELDQKWAPEEEHV
jgi:hypothetical protein